MQRVSDAEVPVRHCIFSKIVHRRQISDAGIYRVAGEKDTVYWNKGLIGAGQTSIFGGIYMDPEEIPDPEGPVADLVFLHERGHKVRNSFIKLVYYPLVLLSALVSLSALPAAVGAILGVLVGTRSPAAGLGAVMAFLLVFLIFSLVANTEELAAELYAFYRLGEDRWRAAINRPSPERNLVQKVMAKIIYPSNQTVRYVAKTKIGEFLGHKPA